MFETDFARPQRKMAVGRSISSEKRWLFCQMRPVKTTCQVAHCFHACKSTWQGVKTDFELIQDGKWKNWISANFYIRVMKLVCLQFRLKAMSSILCSNSTWSKNERRVEGKGHEARASPVLYLFPIKTMPNASCPIRWALLTASTILILASASRGLWKRHSGIPVWKCPKCHIEAMSSSVNLYCTLSHCSSYPSHPLDWAAGRNVMSQGCSQRPNLLDSRQHRQPDWRL